MKWSRLCFAALALVCGCAYYNTFYTARKAWNSAMDERRRNVLEGPSPNELNFYSTAIRASQKLIRKFPDSKYVDDAMLLMARAYQGRSEYDLALDRFHTLADSLPTSELVPDALMGQGEVYSALRRYAEAESTYASVLARAPNFSRADELMFARGELEREQHKGREALYYYTRVIEEYPKSQLRYQAQSRRGESYFQLEEWDSARAEFEGVAREALRADQRLDAGLKVGEAYERALAWDKAISQYRGLLPEAGKLLREPEIQVRIAGAVLGGGDVDRAIELYVRQKELNSSNKYGSVATFQLGYIYENYKEDFDKAREQYDAVRSLPRSEFTVQADERTTGLKQAAEFRKKLNEGKGRFDSKAEAAYLLGELLYFQLKQPSRALDQFLAVERGFSYTRFGPKAAYSAAWVLGRQQRVGASDSAFARAAARYPSTAFGQAALDSLRARRGAMTDSLVALAVLDTFNFPLPKPAEAVADSIAQAAFADSVRKAEVADSLRYAAKRDTLEQSTRAQAALDSAEDVRTGRRPPPTPVARPPGPGRGIHVPAAPVIDDSSRIADSLRAVQGAEPPPPRRNPALPDSLRADSTHAGSPPRNDIQPPPAPPDSGAAPQAPFIEVPPDTSAEAREGRR